MGRRFTLCNSVNRQSSSTPLPEWCHYKFNSAGVPQLLAPCSVGGGYTNKMHRKIDFMFSEFEWPALKFTLKRGWSPFFMRLLFPEDFIPFSPTRVQSRKKRSVLAVDTFLVIRLSACPCLRSRRTNRTTTCRPGKGRNSLINFSFLYPSKICYPAVWL